MPLLVRGLQGTNIYLCLYLLLLFFSCYALSNSFASSWTPPGSSLHGILQARILEWVAMPSSRGSSKPKDWTHIFWVSCIWQTDSLPLSHWGRHLYLPCIYIYMHTYWLIYIYTHTHTYIHRLFYFKDWLKWAQMVKNLPAMPETRFNLWVREIHWKKQWLPILVFMPGEFHGQRSLMGYSPWGHK